MDQFASVLGPKLAEKGGRSEIANAFRLFDLDDQGKISLDNLRRVSKELGENISDEELKVKCLSEKRNPKRSIGKYLKNEWSVR